MVWIVRAEPRPLMCLVLWWYLLLIISQLTLIQRRTYALCYLTLREFLCLPCLIVLLLSKEVYSENMTLPERRNSNGIVLFSEFIRLTVINII